MRYLHCFFQMRGQRFMGSAKTVARRGRVGHLRHEIRQRIDQVVGIEVLLQQRVVGRGAFVGQVDTETVRNLPQLGDGRALDTPDEVAMSVGWRTTMKATIF